MSSRRSSPLAFSWLPLPLFLSLFLSLFFFIALPVTAQGDEAAGDGNADAGDAAEQKPPTMAELAYADALEVFRGGKRKKQSKREFKRECEELFQRIVDEYPDTNERIASVYCRSLCQAKQARYERAIEGIEEFLAMPSDSVPPVRAYLLLGECRYKMRRWDEAAQPFEKVIADFPDSALIPEALFWLGLCLREGQRFDEAWKHWEALQLSYENSPYVQKASLETLVPAAERIAPHVQGYKKLRRKARRPEDEQLQELELYLKEIGKVQGEESEKFLLKVLTSEKGDLQQSAVEPLLNVSGPRATRKLLEQLGKFAPDTRREAFHALQAFQLKGLPLEKLLAKHTHEDRFLQVRNAALELLGRIDSLEAVTLIVDSVQNEAKAASRPSLTQDTYTRKNISVIRALRDTREEAALEYLYTTLKSPETPLVRRMVIADALGHTRGAGAPTALTAVLAEREGLGQIALQSLGRLRDRDTLIPILNELKNRGDDFEFQLAVLEVIGLMPEPPPADDLLALGQHREADFRIQWLLCVKNFLNDPAVLRGVLKYFEDPDWQVRQAAIEIIGGFRNFDVIDTLIRRLAEEPEKALRPIIRERLALITGSDYGDDVAVWQEYWKQAKDRWHELEKARQKRAAKRAGDGSVAKQPGFQTGLYFGLRIEANNVLFLIDGSASMGAEVTVLGADTQPVTMTKMAVAREELVAALSGLDEDKRFNVAVFRNDHMVAFPKARKPTSKAIDTTESWLMGLTPKGNTDLYGVMKWAMDVENVGAIFLLSDGDPTGVGTITDTKTILEKIMEKNRTRDIAIYTVSLGVKSELMRSLAKLNYGKYVRAGIFGVEIEGQDNDGGNGGVDF